jgi:hypothetical protein
LICSSIEPESNDISESALHPEQQSTRRSSTDAGIQIDRSEEHCENALAQTLLSLDPDSNVKFESAVQDEKQDLQRISTDTGMQIDSRDEQPEKADVSIRRR